MEDRTPARIYRIETDRLVIRCYRPEDAVLLKKSIDASLEHLRPWLRWAHDEPESHADKLARLRRYRGEYDLGIDQTMGIFNRDDTELIGSTGFHPRLERGQREIGYWIAARHVGRGYASEAVAALVKVAFEIEGWNRLEIRCATTNVISERIPRRLGFTFLRRAFLDADEATEGTRHMNVYELKREDYRADPVEIPGLRLYDVLGRPVDTGS